jgi:hypothetical protein
MDKYRQATPISMYDNSHRLSVGEVHSASKTE